MNEFEARKRAAAEKFNSVQDLVWELRKLRDENARLRDLIAGLLNQHATRVVNARPTGLEPHELVADHECLGASEEAFDAFGVKCGMTGEEMRRRVREEPLR